MLLHLQILKVSFLQPWSYITALCWCLQTHLSSCYLLTSFVPFKLLWNLKCDFLWKFLFRKGQQQRALCVCFLQFPTKMFQLQNEEKNHNKFQALQVCNCSYLCQDLCGDIFMQKPVINLQLHQQPVVGGVFMRIKNWTTICWHNAFKSKSQHPALVGHFSAVIWL